MTKKRTQWQSPASSKLNHATAPRIAQLLHEIREGRHPALKKSSLLLTEVTALLKALENLNSTPERLQLIEHLFMVGDQMFPILDNPEDLLDCYDFASDYYVETAKDLNDPDLIRTSLQKLILHTRELGGVEVLLVRADEILEPEDIREFCEEMLKLAREASEKPEWIDLLTVFAESIQAIDLFARIQQAKHETLKNLHFIEIADFCLQAEDVTQALQWMARVEQPDEKETEELMDLQVACLMAQGKKAEAVQHARAMYERYPGIFNLGRLCGLLPEEQHEPLLLAAMDRNEGIQISFVHLLQAMKRKEMLKSYIQTQTAYPSSESQEDLMDLAAYLKTSGSADIAQILENGLKQ